MNSYSFLMLPGDKPRVAGAAPGGAAAPHSAVCLVFAPADARQPLRKMIRSLAGRFGVSVLVAEARDPEGHARLQEVLPDPSRRRDDSAPLSRGAASRLAEALSSLVRNQCVIYNAPGAAPQPGRRPEVPLTVRQLEVLRLVADGCSIREIAAELRISAKTVEFHKSQITRKLGRRTSADLVKYAIEHGLTQV